MEDKSSNSKRSFDEIESATSLVQISKKPSPVVRRARLFRELTLVGGFRVLDISGYQTAQFLGQTCLFIRSSTDPLVKKPYACMVMPPGKLYAAFATKFRSYVALASDVDGFLEDDAIFYGSTSGTLDWISKRRKEINKILSTKLGKNIILCKSLDDAIAYGPTLIFLSVYDAKFMEYILKLDIELINPKATTAQKDDYLAKMQYSMNFFRCGAYNLSVMGDLIYAYEALSSLLKKQNWEDLMMAKPSSDSTKV
jgi:hypothetical protein